MYVTQLHYVILDADLVLLDGLSQFTYCIHNTVAAECVIMSTFDYD